MKNVSGTFKTMDEVYRYYMIGLIKEQYPPNENLGGQSCGMPICGVKLIHKGLGFEIAISEYRSMIRNYELALTLFKLYIDEIIKL